MAVFEIGPNGQIDDKGKMVRVDQDGTVQTILYPLLANVILHPDFRQAALAHVIIWSIDHWNVNCQEE